MFQPLCFENQKATFKTYDPEKNQKKKDDAVPSTTLIISIKDSAARVLSHIDPEALDMFYTYPDSQNAESPMIEKSEPEQKTKLRGGGKFTKHRPKVELIGAKFLVDYGTKEPMEFETCNLKDADLEMFEGGHCHLTFKVKTSATSKQVEKLHGMLMAEISFTTFPPGADQNHLPL